MKVLITYASKHGSTEEIAKAIAAVLAEEIEKAELLAVEDTKGISKYEAIVLGSAVYAGSWLRAARQFVDNNIQDLESKPLWIFSSGPTGEPDKSSAVEPIGQGVVELVNKLNPIDHKVFYGKLDKTDLNLAERGILRAVKAEYGDFRDFNEIDKWAQSISQNLLEKAND